MHSSNFLNQLETWTPLLVIVGSAFSWIFSRIWKWVKILVTKIHSAHARLDKVEGSVQEIQNDLSHFINTIQETMSDKINTIQTTMSTQFERVSNSIEKIYILMVKKKEI